MKRDYFISVAIASYNGEKYIYDELISILNQLDTQDEIIISDDGSVDDTLKIIKEIDDKRIKVFKGPKKGVIKNFENAIKNSNGKYIFLSDQDDVWEENKVKRVLEIFEKENPTLILHDARVFDSDLENEIISSFYDFRKSKKGYYKNIIKNSYIGCCMAFKSDFKSIILPFLDNIPMHDQFIGLLAEKYGKVIFLKDKLIKYRRHENNVSSMKHDSLKVMLKKRYNLIKAINKRRKELK